MYKDSSLYRKTNKKYDELTSSYNDKIMNTYPLLYNYFIRCKSYKDDITIFHQNENKNTKPEKPKIDKVRNIGMLQEVYKNNETTIEKIIEYYIETNNIENIEYLEILYDFNNQIKQREQELKDQKQREQELKDQKQREQEQREEEEREQQHREQIGQKQREEEEREQQHREQIGQKQRDQAIIRGTQLYNYNKDYLIKEEEFNKFIEYTDRDDILSIYNYLDSLGSKTKEEEIVYNKLNNYIYKGGSKIKKNKKNKKNKKIKIYYKTNLLKK